MNPSGIDGGQFLLQALGNPDILMRIADEYLDIAGIFLDLLAVQNTYFGHSRLPENRADPLFCRARRHSLVNLVNRGTLQCEMAHIARTQNAQNIGSRTRYGGGFGARFA